MLFHFRINSNFPGKGVCSNNALLPLAEILQNHFTNTGYDITSVYLLV